MGLMGLGLQRFGMMNALASSSIGTGKAKSIIMIFNGGAPSHIDL